MSCVFCEIIDQGKYEHDYGSVVGFAPRHPVTPGHYLFVPKEHVTNAFSRPSITADTMQAACFYSNDLLNANIITSVGSFATQTVFHLHIHVVPRRMFDGLKLPWTGQKK